jgi:hypothetical protein
VILAFRRGQSLSRTSPEPIHETTSAERRLRRKAMFDFDPRDYDGERDGIYDSRWGEGVRERDERAGLAR